MHVVPIDIFVAVHRREELMLICIERPAHSANCERVQREMTSRGCALVSR